MGWTFNTKNPDAPTRGPLVTVVGIIFTSLSLLAVILRCYVRLVILRKPGLGNSFIRVSDYMTY
jgi:hypothetical protein